MNTVRSTIEVYTNIECELWISQRDIDESHVENIVNYQSKLYEERKYFIFPSALVIVNFKDTCYLIDGQHRLKAIKILYEKYKRDIEIPVIYYNCDNKKDVDRLYTMINNINTNNCMVENGNINTNGLMLKQIHQQLKQLYNCKIWDDKKVAKPYVNLNILDEELKDSKLLETKTVAEIIKAIQSKNNSYKKTLDKDLLSQIEQNCAGFCLQYTQPKVRWIRTLFDT
jgi:hypothetical protein